MQTYTGNSATFDLADMIGNLPDVIAGGLAGVAGAPPRQNRRLPERILVAAHQACDLGDLDVASQLLSILEIVVGQGRGAVDPARRRVMESLIAAHQRLWHLRNMGSAASASATAATSSSGSFHEITETPDFSPPAHPPA